MTIIEAIGRVDNIKPNQYSETDKIAWLSHIDGIIKAKVYDTHQGEEVIFNGYDENTDVYNTQLLVKAPYDQLYIHWLSAQIDLANGETNRYNVEITLFNTYLEDYTKSYTRKFLHTAPLRNEFLF